MYDEDPELNPLAEDFYMLGRGPNSLNFENVGWYYDEADQAGDPWELLVPHSRRSYNELTGHTQIVY